jgi:tryptophan synthase beta chain
MNSVRLIGVEAGGRGIEGGEHAARFAGWGGMGVLQGTRSYVLQDSDGQIALTHSISAGLDYASHRPRARLAARPGAHRIHLRHRRRSAGRRQAAQPAAKASSPRWRAPTASPIWSSWRHTMRKDEVILVNLSGRGDKDLGTIMKEMGKRCDKTTAQLRWLEAGINCEL